MRLFIAEKSSIARAIADVLPPPRADKRGFIECSGGRDVVVWCAGHILEQALPEAYNAAFKAWTVEHLPIIPTTWQLEPKTDTADLLKTIRSLIGKAERVVNAGDLDREGQLLVDEVIGYLGYRGPVDRLRINDANPDGVRAALAAISPNAQWRPLYESALGRQRADWLWGLNLTRLYTLLGRAAGHSGVLSVGRVQTPVLGLVVGRDLEIENFKPRPYFTLAARIGAGAQTFTATWKPGEADQPHLDASGRLTSRTHAESICSAVRNGAVVLDECACESKNEPAPLPYSLQDLQIDAFRRCGVEPDKVLTICQTLYETHRLTTYPRTDCPYLPEAHLGDAPKVLAAIKSAAPALAAAVAGADLSLRSRAWQDAKVTAHHAIIPTTKSSSPGCLSPDEAAVYDLIARRYIAQFLPPHTYQETRIALAIAGQRFTATGRTPQRPGWHIVLPPAPSLAADAEAAEDKSPPDQTLPHLSKDVPLAVLELVLSDRKTKPPARFTPATLLEAMGSIHRFVSHPETRKILRETDGLGTPATQASILPTLEQRGYVAKKGRHLVSTPAGRALIAALPTVATTPDLTAVWESALRRISLGELPLKAFLHGVETQLRQVIDAGKTAGPLVLPGARRCPQAGCTGFLRLREGPKGAFWSCTRYPECKYAESQASAAPAPATRKRAHRGRRAS